MLRTYLLVLSFPSLIQAQILCKDFTVGLCTPAEEEVIDTYPIPNVEGAEALCQDVCNIQEGCFYFHYSWNTSTCSLLHYNHLQSCQLMSGRDSTSLEQCMESDRDCEKILMEEDCQYMGDLVLEKTSITDTHSCQQLLAILGGVYKAEYFVFDNEKSLCSLYSSTERNCSSVSGPVRPSIEECQDQTPSSVNTLVMLGRECGLKQICPTRTEARLQLVTQDQSCSDAVAPFPIHPPSNSEDAMTVPSFTKYKDSLLACHRPFHQFPNNFLSNDSRCFIYESSSMEWQEGPTMRNVQIYFKQINVGRSVLTLGAGHDEREPEGTVTVLSLEEGSTEWIIRPEWKMPSKIFEDLNNYQPCIVVVKNRYIHTIGGNRGSRFLDKMPNIVHYMLDTNDNVGWVELESKTFFSLGHACLAVENGLFVSGGLIATDHDQGYANFTSRVDFYDVDTMTWEEVDPLVEARGWHIMGHINGYPAVMGGLIWDENYRMDIEVYEETKWNQIASELEDPIVMPFYSSVLSTDIFKC